MRLESRAKSASFGGMKVPAQTFRFCERGSVSPVKVTHLRYAKNRR